MAKAIISTHSNPLGCPHQSKKLLGNNISQDQKYYRLEQKSLLAIYSTTPSFLIGLGDSCISMYEIEKQRQEFIRINGNSFGMNAKTI